MLRFCVFGDFDHRWIDKSDVVLSHTSSKKVGLTKVFIMFPPKKKKKKAESFDRTINQIDAIFEISM